MSIECLGEYVSVADFYQQLHWKLADQHDVVRQMHLAYDMREHREWAAGEVVLAAIHLRPNRDETSIAITGNIARIKAEVKAYAGAESNGILSRCSE